MYTAKKSHIKKLISDFMRNNCYGYALAIKRADILIELPVDISDRLFRRIISELKHEGNVASHSSRGYWFLPLQSNDPLEIEWMVKSWKEMRSKALNMLTDCDRSIKTLEMRSLVAKGEQKEFAGLV